MKKTMPSFQINRVSNTPLPHPSPDGRGSVSINARCCPSTIGGGVGRGQQGFSIVSAIFLLVVLSFLGVAMVTFSTSQHQSSAMDVMGARAYQAARAGIEWGAYQVLQTGGGCGAASSNLVAGTMSGTLSGFNVNVQCSSTAHSEAAATVTIYQITSTARQGAPATPGYVERQMTVTIAP